MPLGKKIDQLNAVQNRVIFNLAQGFGVLAGAIRKLIQSHEVGFEQAIEESARNQFAAAAMGALIRRSWFRPNPDKICRRAWQMARAMKRWESGSLPLPEGVEWPPPPLRSTRENPVEAAKVIAREAEKLDLTAAKTAEEAIARVKDLAPKSVVYKAPLGISDNPPDPGPEDEPQSAKAPSPMLGDPEKWVLVDPGGDPLWHLAGTIEQICKGFGAHATKGGLEHTGYTFAPVPEVLKPPVEDPRK